MTNYTPLTSESLDDYVGHIHPTPHTIRINPIDHRELTREMVQRETTWEMENALAPPGATSSAPEGAIGVQLRAVRINKKNIQIEADDTVPPGLIAIGTRGSARAIEFRSISVVVFPEDGLHVAQGLQLDMAAQGETEAQALDALQRLCAARYLTDAALGRKAFQGLNQAPQAYWTLISPKTLRAISIF